MIKLVDIGDIRASAYNPRIADPRRLDLIELSLRKLGFLLPIYADSQGEILSGHQRRYISERMGVLKVPVEFVGQIGLSKRKNMNIVFNRATNDMKRSETSSTLFQRIDHNMIDGLAAVLPDIDIHSDDFYPCLSVIYKDVSKLVKLNIENMDQYTLNLANTLKINIGVEMPVILDEADHVVNGVGRLNLAARQGRKTIKAIVLPDEKAKLAYDLLNMISMDFDIQNRYADVLRYNSFMRSRVTRGEGFGDGFFKGVFPRNKAIDFAKLNGDALNKWKKHYGASIIDFGAGKLYNTRILRSAGIFVSAFEPYFIAVGDTISKQVSIDLTRLFLRDIASGIEYDSIFISSVFNSVPFMADRKAIAVICAALCSPKTKVVCWAQGANNDTNKNSRLDINTHRSSVKTLLFAVDYEPNVTIGDLATCPKVQKYHTRKEIAGIFSPCFRHLIRLDDIHGFWYMEADGAYYDARQLNDAIEFEFNLPYPDGTGMGMVEEAKKAFEQRLKISF